MAKFVFSAFSDEIDASFDKQIEYLKALDIHNMEIRGVDGKSFAALSDDEVRVVKRKLDSASIGLSALGSPIGKFTFGDDFEAHLKLAERVMDIGEMLGCCRMRVFSFYPANGMDDAEFEKNVFESTERLLLLAEKRSFTLCHENEKSIYGCSPEREERLCRHFDGRLRVVLDPGNFAFCGIDGSNAWSLLKEYIDYFHIKDCDKNGCIVPPGEGCGLIRETLTEANAERDGEVVLTMEPHLCVFTGLSTLSKLDDIKQDRVYASPFDAFSQATSATREILSSIK